VIVREATPDDLRATALVVAAVAPEGFLAAQPPVDLDERTGRFRRTVESGETARLWVLEDGERAGHDYQS
jgi:hypothetical protein